MTIEDDDLGTARVQDAFPRFSETPGEVTHLGPRLGEHNDEIYAERLQYDAETLRELHDEEVI